MPAPPLLLLLLLLCASPVCVALEQRAGWDVAHVRHLQERVLLVLH
jgi:hypothetical protein